MRIYKILATVSCIALLMLNSCDDDDPDRPLVRMPVASVKVGTIVRSSKCSDPDFTGSVTVELVYPLPPPQNRAEVRVTLEVVDKDNVSVGLDSTDLGVFRNDATPKTSITGSLTKPCKKGKFAVRATITNLGDGLSIVSGSGLKEVKAVPFKLTSFPVQADLTDAVNFNTTFTIDCCDPPPGGAPQWTIKSIMENNVESVTITPNTFTCGAAGPLPIFVVKGKKTDPNIGGNFTLVATAGDQCTLGTIMVE